MLGTSNLGSWNGHWSPFPNLRGNDGASDEVRRPADSEDPGGAHEGGHGDSLGNFQGAKLQKSMEIH